MLDLSGMKRVQAVVLSRLTNAVDEDLQGTAAHTETTREGWKDLEDRFTQGIALRVYELKRAIALLQQEKSTVPSYYGKLKSVWGESQDLNPTPAYTCGCPCRAAKKIHNM